MDAPGTQEKQAKQVRRSRHGLHALKVAVQVRGLSAIDARSSAAQGLLAWRRELIQDLGGAANLSAQKQALIELAVRSDHDVRPGDSGALGIGNRPIYGRSWKLCGYRDTKNHH